MTYVLFGIILVLGIGLIFAGLKILDLAAEARVAEREANLDRAYVNALYEQVPYPKGVTPR